MRLDVHDRIAAALGTKAGEVSRLSGGCVGEVYQAHLEDGRQVVVKVDRRKEPNLDIEGYMLRYLAEHSPLPCPAVYHAEPTLLVMDWLPGSSSFSDEAEEHAAELLAACHKVRGEQCGLERATLIGALHQPNPWTSNWVEFFREHRLMHMAEHALMERKLDRDGFRRIAKFAEKLESLLEEPPYPSLLHGDVWTSNVLANNKTITGFLDPAVYYGHPEIELAFITLFSTFGRPFFDRYAKLREIRPGFFETRCEIYNMYPLLVHTRLFGSSYLGGVMRVLSKHGC